MSDTRTQVTLVTGSQEATLYELSFSKDLGIGSVGFEGSTEREPYLEGAVALSDTTVELTFSERMDRQLAEVAGYYHLVDPDTDEDVDIEVEGAALQDDLRTVILTTTPQRNQLYTVQTSNVKSRFSCEDGDVTNFGAGASTPSCASAYRPLTTKSEVARFEVTARTQVTAGGHDPRRCG